MRFDFKDVFWRVGYGYGRILSEIGMCQGSEILAHLLMPAPMPSNLPPSKPTVSVPATPPLPETEVSGPTMLQCSQNEELWRVDQSKFESYVRAILPVHHSTMYPHGTNIDIAFDTTQSPRNLAWIAFFHGMPELCAPVTTLQLLRTIYQTAQHPPPWCCKYLAYYHPPHR